MDAELLTRAVVAWTGWETSSWPDRSDARVVALFGADIVQAVRALERDFFASEAYRTDSSLAEMGERAAADFRARHPSLGEAAVQALAWCYTYDYK